MAADNSQLVALLNGLIETCKDGEKGYREAADGVENAFYRMLFQEYSRLRTKYVSELKGQVVALGGQPDRKGSVKGAIHRGWMNLKTAIAGNDDDLIVAECKRGDELAIRQYKDALKLDLPPKVRTIVERQMNEIISTQKRVQAMDSKSR